MTEMINFVEEGVTFLLPSDELIHFSEVDACLLKLKDVIREYTQAKADVFLKRKEKIQQHEHDQLVKLKLKEDEYTRKSEAAERDLEECKLELNKIEYKYFDTRSKLSIEQDINRELQDHIMLLRSEKEEMNEKLKSTWKQYLTVLNWYKEYLHIHLQLDIEDMNLCTIMFDCGGKTINGKAYIKFQVIDGNKFKLLKIHPQVENQDMMKQQLSEGHQLTSFICNFYTSFVKTKIILKT